MVSTFLGIQTALRGLLAQQRALDVTSHNIANAGTKGYSRQEALQQTTLALSLPSGGQLGTGVEVTEYRRIRDEFLDVQIRAQTMLQSYHEARRDGLEQVELGLAEPSTSGIGAMLDRYFASWHDVASTPENPSARTALVQSASALAEGFNSLHSQLTTVDSQTQSHVSLTIDELNSIIQRIANVEVPIVNALGSGVQPSNDLLDERDSLVDRLSQLANVTVTTGTGGWLTIKTGTKTLLTGGTPTTINSVSDFVDSGTGVDQLTSGQLKGLVDLSTKISGAGGYIERLNGVAAALMSSVDTLHAAGYALGSSTPSGQRFFSGTDASSIAVNSALAADPLLIAASSQPGEPGNGDNARAIAALQSSATIGGAYRSLVVSIGSDTADARRNADNAKVVTDALENRRQSVSGVSLDEEMANLVRFQRGFQAASRALSAMDDMIDLLISRTGRVGL